jgi:aminomethyltransferase
VTSSAELAAEVRALRRSSGLSRAEHIAAIEITGVGALDLLQLATTQSPHRRAGRVRQTLMLRDDGSVLADVFVLNTGDAFVVLAEGPDEDELVAWLEGVRGRGLDKEAQIRGMRADWVVFGIDGPFAWEVVAGMLGPAVLGMPYLSVVAREQGMCVRAGKTGEYGYLLIVPRASAASVEGELRKLGGPLDLAPVSLEALDVCALESGHFAMRWLRERGRVLTPIELQLQWRVTYSREFVGADALRARRSEGAKERVTCFVADGPVAPGQRVRLGALELGEVLTACASPTTQRTVGWALLARAFAHPHLDLEAVATDGALPLRTCPAFLFENLSLRVQPHLGHTYAKREEIL